ncbi:MAG TPA: hypothetical protein PLN04_03955 [Moraxellaceae bacterium]|nr:hypothetical protein [Moraxellaceae bacterium]
MSRRQTGWLAAALIMGVFGIWSILGMVADIAAFRGGAWVEAWSFQLSKAQTQNEFFSPQDEDWQQAYALANLAVRLSPMNADYREGLARIHEARFIMAPIGDPEARPEREKAIASYRDSIRLRPTWPYAHAALAYALVRAGGHDAEMESALAEAARLGPWEPKVMEAIVDIGLDGWYRISPASRVIVSNTLLRSQSWAAGQAGQQHADRAWARVEAHHKQALVCAILPMQDERNRQHCNSANWK